MDVLIRDMKEEDYIFVSEIYSQGIKTKCATFQTEIPSYEDWDKAHLKYCRLVAVNEENTILGWAALSPTSSRCVYKGVAEVSVYISEEFRGRKIGSILMNDIIDRSETFGIWTLQSSIIERNKSSIELHKKSGFRMVGFRENIAQDVDGNWQNTVLFERRSDKIGIC